MRFYQKLISHVTMLNCRLPLPAEHNWQKQHGWQIDCCFSRNKGKHRFYGLNDVSGFFGGKGWGVLFFFVILQLLEETRINPHMSGIFLND